MSAVLFIEFHEYILVTIYSILERFLVKYKHIIFIFFHDTRIEEDVLFLGTAEQLWRDRSK